MGFLTAVGVGVVLSIGTGSRFDLNVQVSMGLFCFVIFLRSLCGVVGVFCLESSFLWPEVVGRYGVVGRNFWVLELSSLGVRWDRVLVWPVSGSEMGFNENIFLSRLALTGFANFVMTLRTTRRQRLYLCREIDLTE